ncbi:PhoH family protein (plasmid) [Paenibacillus thiaminolyticus]|uniref:PhoH family protein n=1 Tax=Paenibacillus thiaminolyticus TaxID=49283 RepID=UPI0023301F9D|nr:PhoH family protein [Paenibacillus thiaminolyticus]WCF11385.1 PhoH family protein [Paenibacillus thiaminolyticus]
MKKFVVDTSVLIYDVDSLYKFQNNEVIIPSIVYEEINLLKEENTERGYYARKISEVLDDLSKTSPLKEGVMLNNTRIRTSYNIHNADIKKAFILDKNDYKIISCAKNEQAILVTRDRMMRVMARDFIQVEEYHADRVKVDELYKGYRKQNVPPGKIEKLYQYKLENEFNLSPNEFVILINRDNPAHTGVGICKKNRVLPLSFDRLVDKRLKLKLTPLNLEQKMLLYLMLDKDVTCVTATGKSGKGKSLLAIDYALASVQAQQHTQFMYTKSIISVDQREELGYYKGDLEEKLKPHLQPLYSSIELLYKKDLYQSKSRKTVDQKVEELLNMDVLRFYPLANIRGMSVFDKVVMLDEAQNVTNHMIKSLVTRINDSSKLIVTGDIEQIDDRNLNKFNNGLTHLVEAGKEEEFIGHICMDLSGDSKRGKLATFGSLKL